MNKEVIIIGASGHGKVIADMVIKNGDTVTGFLDDDPTKTEVSGFPVLGKTEACLQYQNQYFVIGIGNNAIRKQIAEKYHLQYITIIHPKAVIAENVWIGEGSVVMAGAVINPDTTIGRHCIINTAAVIEHDNRIGDYTHISPNATLCGTVQTGQSCHIGAGATIINNRSICDQTIIGAGSTVIKNITEEGTYVGSPVRKIK